MSRFFNPDSPIMSFLSDALDFIVLNLLAVVCALPVVTAGASFSALAGVMSAYTLDKTPIRARDFFLHFRAVFLRATLSWVILLAASALFFMDLRIAETMPPALRLASISGLLFFLLCLYLTAVFLFPMLSFADGIPLKKLWRGAFILAVRNLPRSVLMILLYAIPVILFILLPRVFIFLSPIWFGVWFSLAAFLCAKICGRRYRIDQSSL